MKLMHWLFSAVMSVGVLIGSGKGALAAGIDAYDDPYLGCIVKIQGVIQPGDAKVLERVLKAELIRRGARGDRLEYMNENGHRICLDSPGGSFAEGLRMAELIHGAVGTAIPRGAECLSACSAVFMAGSHQTESSAGIVANRKLHAGGQLGFHAPSLEVPARNYSEREVNKAYSIAVAGLGSLLERSSDMKLSQTLISEMLKTPTEDMFMIDTVHKAGRWLIPVVGAVRPREITPLAVSNACNAYYGWTGDRLASNGFGFNPDPAQRWGWGGPVRRSGDQVTGESQGFGQEGSLTCRVRVDTSAGADDADSIWGTYGYIRMGEDDVGFEASSVTFFDPRTKLAALVRPSDKEVVLRDVSAFTPADKKTRETTCSVFKGNRELDRDPCRLDSEKRMSDDLKEREVLTFTWPSGAKTVIVWDDNGTEINGKGAKRIFTDGPVRNATCYVNSASGNTFCFAS